MGFDVSGTHMIFFIAAVILAAGVVGVLTTSVNTFAGELDTRGQSLAAEMATDIRIINDPADVPNNPLVLYVLNTGSRPIAPQSAIVFVDGQAYTTLGLDVLGTNDEVHRQGQVLEITVTGLNVASGDHRVKVTMAHGVSDSIPFYIP